MQIGFCGILTIALTVLKLIGTISLSWVWVFAPLWIPLAFITAFMVIVLVVVMIVALWES